MCIRDRYSNDWHNKCFYANYEEKLKGKKIIFIADSYYYDWIDRILFPIEKCTCVSKYTLGNEIAAIEMIKEHEADYIGIASRNWKAIEKEIINQALPNTSIIYAFFCRKADIA